MRYVCLLWLLGWKLICNRTKLNTLRPRQNGRHFPDDIFKWISLNESVWILIKISLNFVPRGPINNIPALVQIMAWRQPGDKPLSEPMMFSLPTHICVTLPQWVNVLMYAIPGWCLVFYSGVSSTMLLCGCQKTVGVLHIPYCNARIHIIITTWRGITCRIAVTIEGVENAYLPGNVHFQYRPEGDIGVAVVVGAIRNTSRWLDERITWCPLIGGVLFQVRAQVREDLSTPSWLTDSIWD